LPTWLAHTGGLSPRGWLESAAPLVEEFLHRAGQVPIERWHEIRARSPLPLSVNEEEGHVTVGWHRITDVPPVPLAILRYLWQHRGRYCTRQELYYHAWFPTRYPEASPDKAEDFEANYGHLIETAISRLREKIEPDASSPTYVVTVWGKGYQLKHAW
jgi:DNA-binding response OmpR family regulator